MDVDDEIALILGKPNPAPLGDGTTAAILGEWLNLSPARIHALAREGVIPRTEGRFDLQAAVRAYCKHLRAGQRGRLASNPDLNEQKVRLAKASAEKIELANAKARGEMVLVVSVEAAWASVLRDVRAAMLSIPARVGQRLGHLSPHDVQMIDREVRDSLQEASGPERLENVRY